VLGEQEVDLAAADAVLTLWRAQIMTISLTSSVDCAKATASGGT
jgi:hypothetical protein